MAIKSLAKYTDQVAIGHKFNDVKRVAGIVTCMNIDTEKVNMNIELQYLVGSIMIPQSAMISILRSHFGVVPIFLSKTNHDSSKTNDF